jgi:hypothetical protein
MGKKYAEFDADAEMLANEGYFIVRANTTELLHYFAGISKSSAPVKSIRSFLNDHNVAFLIKQKHPARPVESFYKGNEPIWNDIIEERIPILSFYHQVCDKLLSSNHVHITGCPGSGKTTLLMQVSKGLSQKYNVFYFQRTSKEEAAKYVQLLSKESNILICLDNLSDNHAGFSELAKMRDVKFVTSERDAGFDRTKGLFPSKEIEIIDISDISMFDISEICRKMARPLQNNQFQKVSLFEIVHQLWNNKSTVARIQELINTFVPSLLEFYTLNTYTRFCNSACSMDMALAYYDYAKSYKEIYSMLNQINSLIDDQSYSFDSDQDVFTLRSRIFCEISLNCLRGNPILGQVIFNFHSNIDKSIIFNFNTFKIKAWDADLTTHSFPKEPDGISFYNMCLRANKSPFILQQYALYPTFRRLRQSNLVIKTFT